MTGKRFSTSNLIAKVRRHQKKHKELQQSHHFVFDCPLDPKYEDKPDFVWFGVNPGNDEEDWERFKTKGNTEETRDFDFQAEWGRSKASCRRMNALRRFLGHDVFRRTTHCELFFWGSKDTGKSFEQRYGYPFDESNPHWNFCCDRNKELIERIRPKAIMAESRKKLSLYECRLGLLRDWAHQHHSTTGELLIEERRFEDSTPFYCFDHLSAIGKAAARRSKVKEKLADLLENSN